MSRDGEVPMTVSVTAIVDGVEVPLGHPRDVTISRRALDLLHGNVSPLDERRQRAREAAYDDLDSPTGELGGALEAAIETATRVKITPEIIEAARLGWASARGNWDSEPRETSRLIAAFRAAGFEVEL